ncbi:MAG: ABC transporter substrate-binding protein [Pseudomonadota bacterium]|nr:ABC transporter substrate-binding protein [Pseudomonadota bacterium]
MKTISRRTTLLAALATTALTLLAPMGATAQEDPQPSRTLLATWGGFEPQAVFVPAGGGGSPEFTSTKILEPMLEADDELNFEPVLATAVTPSEDFMSYTITIREGVTWHDGTPFTTDDVVFNAMEYWKGVVASAAFQFLTGAEATGENEVTLTFSQPTPEFFLKSALVRVLVIPKHIYEGTEFATNEANNAPIGTGPFVFEEWVRGSHIEYSKNENYWADGQPYADGLIIRYWRDPSSRTAAFEAGEVDIGVYNPIPAADIDRLGAMDEFATSTGGYLTSAWASTIEFNSRNPIVSEVPVRQAIMHAIDKAFIADVIYSGKAVPGTSFVSSSNSKFYSDDVPQYAYDPELAAQMLDEAGYPVGDDGTRFSIELVAAGWFEENAQIGQYVKQALGDIGIEANLNVPDRPSSFRTIYGEYAYDIALSNHSAPAELVPVQTNFVTTSGILKGVPFRNASGYSNPELDAIVENLTSETDEAVRAELAHEMQTILAEDLPITILVEHTSTTVASADVKGYDHLANILANSWAGLWIDESE